MTGYTLPDPNENKSTPMAKDLVPIYSRICNISQMIVFNALGITIANGILWAAILIIAYDTLPEKVNSQSYFLGEGFVYLSYLTFTFQLLGNTSCITLINNSKPENDTDEEFISVMNDIRRYLCYCDLFFQYGVIHVAVAWYLYVSISFCYLGLWEEGLFTAVITGVLLATVVDHFIKLLTSNYVVLNDEAKIRISIRSLIYEPDEFFRQLVTFTWE